MFYAAARRRETWLRAAPKRVRESAAVPQALNREQDAARMRAPRGNKTAREAHDAEFHSCFRFPVWLRRRNVSTKSTGQNSARTNSDDDAACHAAGCDARRY